MPLHLSRILTLNRFKTHWQWVVMIIVLAVGLALLGIIGTILHKRYVRRRDYGDSTAPMTSNPQMSTWAPSQHSVHDFGNRGANNGAMSSGTVGPSSEAPPVPVSAGPSRTATMRNSNPDPDAVGRAPSRRLTKTPVGVAR